MAVRLAASVFAVVLAAGPKPCWADAESAAEARLGEAAAADRWSIRAFLRRSESRTNPRRQAHAPPARSDRWYRSAYAQYTDTSSPLSRLKALRNWRLATLWRGRESSLVLGLVDDAYFGVRLDADDPLTDRNQ